MDKRFLSAFTDPTDRIKLLGRSVSPFCLLHRVQLQAADSPLLRPDADIRPVDLLVAVKVCAGEPIGKPSWLDSWHLGKMANNQMYFAEQIERFSQYVLVDAWPKFWARKAKTAESNGVPWCLSVVANLVCNGVPIEQAWRMPESQAIWMNSAFAVIKGAELKVLTTEEEELMEEISRL